jgi:deazaflavin-dependent oxidoreductase (nitroreductase family)
MSDADANPMKSFNDQIIEEFRANDGKVGGPFEGAPMVLVTTTGARSGRRHTTPVVYGSVDGQLFIVASKAGADTNPAWFHNLVANPTVSLEIGSESFDATATVAEEPERSRLYQEMVAVMPGFAEYQEKTSRVIPVVLLDRVG